MNLPDLFLGDRIPCHELAAIASRARIHVDRSADEWRTCDIADLARLKMHAEMLVRHVEQFGPRRPGGGLPVLCAGGGRTDVIDGLADDRRLLAIRDDLAGFQVNALV